MVQFKKNYKNKLPYDRDKYIEFLDVDFDSPTEWCGVSFQLPGGYEGRDIGLTEFTEKYELWFKDIISGFDNGSNWIVNHSKRDVQWLPNKGNTLPLLRDLFKKNRVRGSFKGALIFSTEDQLKIALDIISYPHQLFRGRGLYNDLDISNNEFPLIIKTSHHANIDLLSTNKEFLQDIVNENSERFIMIVCRGTKLW